MKRTLWMTVTLVVVVAWLLVAYMPGLAAHMPMLAWPAWSLPLLGGLVVLTVAAALAIQGWIVYATDQALAARPDAVREFNLRRSAEAFWTLLPLLMTVALVAAVWLA